MKGNILKGLIYLLGKIDKVLAKRRELVPKMFEARRNGMVAYLRYDKLITHSRNNTSQISASAQAAGDDSIVR